MLLKRGTGGQNEDNQSNTVEPISSDLSEMGARGGGKIVTKNKDHVVVDEPMYQNAERRKRRLNKQLRSKLTWAEIQEFELR